MGTGAAPRVAEPSGRDPLAPRAVEEPGTVYHAPSGGLVVRSAHAAASRVTVAGEVSPERVTVPARETTPGSLCAAAETPGPPVRVSVRDHAETC